MASLERVEELTLALVDGELDQASQTELEAALEASEEARRLYVLVLRLEAGLRGLRAQLDLAPGTLTRLLPQLEERLEQGAMERIRAALERQAAVTRAEPAPATGDSLAALASSELARSRPDGAGPARPSVVDDLAKAGLIFEATPAVQGYDPLGLPLSQRTTLPEPLRRRARPWRWIAAAAAAGVVGLVAGALVLRPGLLSLGFVPTPTQVAAGERAADLTSGAPASAGPATVLAQAPAATPAPTPAPTPAAARPAPAPTKAASAAHATRSPARGGASADEADEDDDEEPGAPQPAVDRAEKRKAGKGAALAAADESALPPAAAPRAKEAGLEPGSPASAGLPASAGVASGGAPPAAGPASERQACERQRLSRDDIADVLRGAIKTAVSACLPPARTRGEATGPLTLEFGFTVQPSGQLSDPRIGPASLAGTGLAACLDARMRGWRFPSFCEGGPVKVPPVKVPIK